MRVVVFALLAVLALASYAEATSKGMWRCKNEIMALPTSGSAYSNTVTMAYGSWPIADLSVQTNNHAAFCMAGALIWARNGDATLRTKVRSGLMSAMRSMDQQSEYDKSGSRTLGVGRQLTGYVIAADLIDFASFAADSEAIFSTWLNQMRTQTFTNSNSSYCKTLVGTHESTNGWGLEAGASRLAIAIYRGQADEVARCDSLFRAHGDLLPGRIGPVLRPGRRLFHPHRCLRAHLGVRRHLKLDHHQPHLHQNRGEQQRL